MIVAVVVSESPKSNPNFFRMQVLKRQIYRFEEFELDVQNRELRRVDGDAPVPLPAKAFDLLLVLVENNNRLIGKDEIFERVWGDQIVEESNLTVHISQIRKALGETKNKPRFITTVPGYGYRFTAEVSSRDNSDLVIETETLARITVEKEQIIEEISDAADAPDASIETKGVAAKAVSGGREKTERRGETKRALGMVAALAVCALLAFGFYQYLNQKRAAPPFEKIKMSRLTNSGKIAGASLSPDGKYVAYVLGESAGNSLWQQQIGTASAIRLVAPVKAEFWGLTYAPDGAFLYYNLFGGDKSDVELFRVSSLGGVVENIPGVITGSVGFAPDGKRIAFVAADSASNANYLYTSNPDGSDKQVVTKKSHPDTFSLEISAEWSPDGETIACLVNRYEADASFSEIVGINPRDGSERLLSERRWFDVFSIEWLRDGSGLLIAAREKMSARNQIWFLPVPTGEPKQITNDLNGYGWISAASGGKSFAAVQNNTVNSIAVGDIGGDDNNFKEIASEIGALFPLVWTPDEKIVFRSVRDGNANLWTMDADGANRRQLTANAQIDGRGMCATADGKYFVFGSWRGGKSNLWRVDAANGASLTQLTEGEADIYPACSPDGKWVVYQRGFIRPMLWKVPVEGGSPVQLTDFRAKWAAISNDGKQISYFHMADNRWRLGFVSSDGGAMLRRVDVPANLVEKNIVWSPDDQSLFYINTVGNVGNIWRLPLTDDASAIAAPVTDFSSHLVADFAVSPDRKRFAVTRTLSVNDVVLIENAASP